MKPIALFSLTVSSIFFLLVWAEPSHALENINGCHCFKNRTYNPIDKFAADEYILATSFNSLLSKYFGISKRQIVLLKMQGGISNDDLLIGLFLAKSSGISLDTVLALKKQNGSWQHALTERRAKDIQIPAILKNLQSGMPVPKVSLKLNELLISDFFNVPIETIKQLHKKKFTEKESTLLVLLSLTNNITIEQIVFQRHISEKSWSEIAHSFGISPEVAGTLIINFSNK